MDLCSAVSAVALKKNWCRGQHAVCVQGQGKRKLLHVPKYDKWDNVFLEYRVNWPLHLLLTPQVTLCCSHSLDIQGLTAWDKCYTLVECLLREKGAGGLEKLGNIVRKGDLGIAVW